MSIIICHKIWRANFREITIFLTNLRRVYVMSFWMNAHFILIAILTHRQSDRWVYDLRSFSYGNWQGCSDFVASNGQTWSLGVFVCDVKIAFFGPNLIMGEGILGCLKYHLSYPSLSPLRRYITSKRPLSFESNEKHRIRWLTPELRKNKSSPNCYIAWHNNCWLETNYSSLNS